MTSHTKQPMPALHALLPAVNAAQAAFDQQPGSQAAASAFNKTLEGAFRAMCLDMRGHESQARILDEASLQTLMAPKDGSSVWFRFADPHVTAERLSDLANTGDLGAFMKAWPGPSRDYLPPGIERTSDERFFARMERSLRGASVIDVGGVQVRYARRGDAWTEGENTLQALNHGLYLRLPAVDRTGAVVDHRWLHHGGLEDLQAVVEPHVERLSAMGREQLMQRMAFDAAMRTILKAEGAARTSAPVRMG